jgi:hypothetical protein
MEKAETACQEGNGYDAHTEPPLRRGPARILVLTYEARTYEKKIFVGNTESRTRHLIWRDERRQLQTSATFIWIFAAHGKRKMFY